MFYFRPFRLIPPRQPGGRPCAPATVILAKSIIQRAYFVVQFFLLFISDFLKICEQNFSSILKTKISVCFSQFFLIFLSFSPHFIQPDPRFEFVYFDHDLFRSQRKTPASPMADRRFLFLLMALFRASPPPPGSSGSAAWGGPPFRSAGSPPPGSPTPDTADTGRWSDRPAPSPPRWPPQAGTR